MSFTRTHDALPNARGDSSRPRFHMAAVEDGAMTAREGRPMFRDVERVQILMPGSFNQPVMNVNDEHRRKWPQEYAAFKAGHTMSDVGTPIEQWPLMTPGRVAMLKALEIHTVEQCAAIPDSELHKVGIGSQGLKRAAAAYLDDAEATRQVTELIQIKDNLESRNAQLEATVKQQGDAIERLQAQMLQRLDAPSAAQTYIPGMHDGAEAQRQAAPMPPAAPSAMDSFPETKRRNRAEAAA